MEFKAFTINKAGFITPWPNDGDGYSLLVQAGLSNPVNGQTIYFGNMPKAVQTTAAISKVYVRKRGTIKMAEIYSYATTAGGSNQWDMSLRLNNTTDTLIASVSAGTNERVFSNTGLSVDVVAGDYFEIKLVNPTWTGSPPAGITFGGYIYIEEL